MARQEYTHTHDDIKARKLIARILAKKPPQRDTEQPYQDNKVHRPTNSSN